MPTTTPITEPAKTLELLLKVLSPSTDLANKLQTARDARDMLKRNPEPKPGDAAVIANLEADIAAMENLLPAAGKLDNGTPIDPSDAEGFGEQIVEKLGLQPGATKEHVLAALQQRWQDPTIQALLTFSATYDRKTGLDRTRHAELLERLTTFGSYILPAAKLVTLAADAKKPADELHGLQKAIAAHKKNPS